MESVVHFEMPCEDRDRVAKFYGDAFGWQMQKMGEEMGNYMLAATAESGADGRPKEAGTINGGFYPKTPDAPHPSVVIAVTNLDASIAAVKKAGGAVLGEPHSIPGIGRYVSFTDTEGNRVSMMEDGEG